MRNGKNHHTKRSNERIIMAQYQVDSEQIQSSSAAVNASIQAIRQSVQGMYANLNNLQSVWRGGAATQFNAVAEQWRAAQQQMEQSLESIQHALSQASMLYLKPKCRRRVCSRSSGRCFRYGQSSSKHKRKSGARLHLGKRAPLIAFRLCR